MQENVGTLDRTARLVAGPLLMGLGATALGGLKGRPGGLVALVAGALIVESAITRVCPVNRLLGVDTREGELRATGP
ncbi:YgaP family membrane protein [Sorangium sp. So ce1099]|uniref:YgaP family membrane protein n=1 Tax=Sorangium sp. So ce1099 TaxID=3133331 RepID=UPI003F5F34FE